MMIPGTIPSSSTTNHNIITSSFILMLLSMAITNALHVTNLKNYCRGSKFDTNNIHSSSFCLRPVTKKLRHYQRSRIMKYSSAFRKSNLVMMPEGPEVRTLVDQLQPGVGLRLCDLQVSVLYCQAQIILIHWMMGSNVSTKCFSSGSSCLVGIQDMVNQKGLKSLKRP